MAYKKGEDRRQKVFFPDCIDEYVACDALVRLFDAFVDSLNMTTLGFVRSVPKGTGTPGYDLRDLLKLYIYGYFYQIRSSRKLARECKCNLKVMWLLGKLYPDFRTISDYRKDNKGIQGVQQVLHGPKALLKVLYLYRWQQVQSSQCQGQQFYA